MIRHPDKTDKLRSILEEVFDLLQTQSGSAGVLQDEGEPLPSLLAQCAALVSEGTAPTPVRTLHHFACTGGTLISKCIAAMPNVTLLSEMDPLSRQMLPRGTVPKPHFSPTDLVYAARTALRPVEDEAIIAVFQAGLRELQYHLAERGSALVLRDHAHSQFCTAQDWRARPTLLAMVAQILPTRSVVTVRHPLDSYLSLQRNRWVHFAPATVEEYCRRYRAFLDEYNGVAVFRYEDFVAYQEAVLEQICMELDLRYSPGVEDLLPVVSLTGDSGRSGNRIESRQRRVVDDQLIGECRRSDLFASICLELGYDIP